MYELTLQEVRHFRDAGYLRLKNNVGDAFLYRMNNVIERDLDNSIAPFRLNSTGLISRLDQIIDRDPVFLEILRLPIVLQPLTSILGPNIEITKYRHNHATLNRCNDIPYRLHRDIQHWSRALVTAIIYLETTTTENGCTHIVPTSQYLSFAGQQSGNGGGNWADEHDMYRHILAQALPVPMPKGGVLLLDSLMFHSVGINYSDSSRKSVTFAFHSSDDLSEPKDDINRILLCGQRTYKGSNVMNVSGSLEKSE